VETRERGPENANHAVRQREHVKPQFKAAARQCEVVTIYSPRLLTIHEFKKHWQGRRSEYPFSGPRSRPDGSACNRQLINTVVGPLTLWQARMGPAPGHPNHLPGSGFGMAGAATLGPICQ